MQDRAAQGRDSSETWPAPDGISAVNGLTDYFRCAPGFCVFHTTGDLSPERGFFTFDGVVCYGGTVGGATALYVDGRLPEVGSAVTCDAGGLALPFDVTE